jgi:hypothetical protein
MKTEAHPSQDQVNDFPADDEHSLEQPENHSFIVRVWQIPKDAGLGSNEWRGSIDHVGQGKRLYFYRIDAILRFIWEQTGLANKQPPSRWVKIRNSFQNWVYLFKASLRGEGK